MAKSLKAYFENGGRMASALNRYSEVAASLNWTIRDSKLFLYRRAEIAFDPGVEEQTRREAFSDIYKSLRRSWQVFRGASSYWEEDHVYTTLTQRCGPTSRNGGLTLARNLLENPSLSSLGAHLETLAELKVKSDYPIMAVSKFSHFFNPCLFPIYDTAVIYNKVLKNAFREDWNAFKPHVPPDFTLNGKEGIWDAFYWIVWGNELIRGCDPKLMEHFAEWFIQETKRPDDDVSDMREELKTYYATAFEFISIGACYLKM
jgi:hypothetical protein